MSDSGILKIEKREALTKGQMRALREEGYVPASMSQRGEEALSFSIKRDELKKALQQGGMSAVYKLRMGNKKALTAMVREIQSAPLTREWLHVTFQHVSMDEETKVELAIVVHGKDNISYKGLEGLQQLDTITVRGLPGDFPQHIEVDASELEAGGQITVADLQVPESLTVETESDRLVYSVSHPRVQEEAPAEETEAAAAPAEAAAEQQDEA